MGVECEFVAEGETKEEALKASMSHAVQAHGMDPAGLSKVDVWEKATPFLKEV